MDNGILRLIVHTCLFFIPIAGFVIFLTKEFIREIKKIEEKLGISIDVEPLSKSLGKQIQFNIDETGAYIVFRFPKTLISKNANIYINKDYLFSATIGRKSQIKMTKDSDLGKELLRALTRKKPIQVYI